MVDQSEIVGLPLRPQFLKNGELGRLTQRETAPHLRLSADKEMMEGADDPLARGVASVTDASILGHGVELRPLAPPAENVPLVNRVQGVDEDESAGDWDAG
jgi:hypothetical protein